MLIGRKKQPEMMVELFRSYFTDISGLRLLDVDCGGDRLIHN